MEILPEQVAQRGFEYGLAVRWVYARLQQAIGDGVVPKPVHRMPPHNQAIAMRFARSVVEIWKIQYDRGKRIQIPRDLWPEIDALLGVVGFEKNL